MEAGADIDSELRQVVKTALANKHDGSVEGMFAELDIDDNGALEQKEVNTLVSMPDLLADIEKLKASTAGDGTYEGYSAPEKAQLQVMKEKAMASAIRRSKLFKLLDADNNKQVTSEEWARHHEL